jgi:cytochrome oxidase assembly protein ShyY1
MEWRSVKVTGEYDFADQVAIRNQYNGSDYGYHLLTPLRFGEGAVLVDRGWIPPDGNATAADWRKYDQPGSVTVSGQLRLGQAKRVLPNRSIIPSCQSISSRIRSLTTPSRPSLLRSRKSN